MDELGKYYSKSEKLDIKSHIWHDSIYINFLEQVNLQR